MYNGVHEGPSDPLASELRHDIYTLYKCHGRAVRAINVIHPLRGFDKSQRHPAATASKSNVVTTCQGIRHPPEMVRIRRVWPQGCTQREPFVVTATLRC